jgi:hypothetical protein
MAFFVDIAAFFRTIDGTLWFGTGGYGTLLKSDKNGLPTVYNYNKYKDMDT